MKGKKLTGKAAIVLIVGGDLLLLLVGWFLLIGPQRATASSIVQATAAAEAQLIEAKRPVVKVKPAAIVQPEIKTANLYSLAKAMPSTVDQPDLLLELDQIARAAGVDVSTISFGQSQASLTDGFSTVAINISFTGDFYSITDLLYRLRSQVAVRNGELQTSGRLFSVGTVGLAPAGTGTANLTATVGINAYVFGGAPAAAPAPAVVPTSTDTSATTTAASSDVAP